MDFLEFILTLAFWILVIVAVGTTVIVAACGIVMAVLWGAVNLFAKIFK